MQCAIRAKFLVILRSESDEESLIVHCKHHRCVQNHNECKHHKIMVKRKQQNNSHDHDYENVLTTINFMVKSKCSRPLYYYVIYIRYAHVTLGR